MIRSYRDLEKTHLERLQTYIEFFEKRLEEKEILDWALTLNSSEWLKKMAILYLLNEYPKDLPKEPWLSAWRLLEESWSFDDNESEFSDIFQINQRIEQGDRTGSLILALVNLVAPRLKISPFNSELYNHFRKKKKKSNILISPRITSVEPIKYSDLRINLINDLYFLEELAISLRSSIDRAISIAKRISNSKDPRPWILGEVKRVSYSISKEKVNEQDRSISFEYEEEPDDYSKGIAPSVKLLFEVVLRISEIKNPDSNSVIDNITSQWRFSEHTIYQRLWAALAIRCKSHISSDQISQFLLNSKSELFWTIDNCEITELRARRFRDLDLNDQSKVIKRITSGPPRSLIRKLYRPQHINEQIQLWSLIELRRIQNGGGELPKAAIEKLAAYENRGKDSIAKSGEFDLPIAKLGNIYFDFPESTKVSWVKPNPDRKFDRLFGLERLKQLEYDLSTQSHSWDNNSVERARDWLRGEGNIELIFADLETTGNSEDSFPCVWSEFGFIHRPKDRYQTDPTEIEIAKRGVLLLENLSLSTLNKAIDSICTWLDAWSNSFKTLPTTLFPIWSKVWPIAVNATNSQAEKTDDIKLDVITSNETDRPLPHDLDTLNSPVGKLVGIFLVICPNLNEKSTFLNNSIELNMRDVIIASEGRSKTISIHRLVEHLAYFLKADQIWAQENLIRPLKQDDDQALALWRAIARRTHFGDVLHLIGDEMSKRVLDKRLWPQTRRQLLFNLVIELLHAYKDNRPSVINTITVKHVLRKIDADIRVHAVYAMRRFIDEIPKDPKESLSAEQTFDVSIKPFIENVWPKERAYLSPAVSAEFAKIPALCGERFVEAVKILKVFSYLMPFECWSLLDYGFYKYGVDEQGLNKIIDNGEKAETLLDLLDLTIGKASDSRIPYDINEALDQIEKCAPSLATEYRFRRIATAARR